MTDLRLTGGFGEGGRPATASGRPTHHILLDIQLDGLMDRDDVLYHRSKVRRAVEDLCPDACVRVFSGRLFLVGTGESETSPVVDLFGGAA